MERVAVDGARLPVLDLDEAGAFGGAAVLQRLGGRSPALSRRLKRDAKRHKLRVFICTAAPSDTFPASRVRCL